MKQKFRLFIGISIAWLILIAPWSSFGATITYTYDDLNRLTGVQYSNSSPSEDQTSPSLAITSHTNNQHVIGPITLAGTASDGGAGDNGISQVTVNGIRAANDTATSNGIANWSQTITLNPGANAITIIAYDNSSNHNQTTQTMTIYNDVPETTPPTLAITSHSNGQHVDSANITLGGMATDLGKGGNGISQVTINGIRADNDTASGNETANWSKAITLNPSANTITVIAYDNSSNQNQTTQTIILYYDTPPGVITSPATNVTPTSGTLKGIVFPNGLITTYHFEWGLTIAYGNSTISQSIEGGLDNVTISANLTGLDPYTNYHYRLVATNSAGTNYGSDMILRRAPFLQYLLWLLE